MSSELIELREQKLNERLDTQEQKVLALRPTFEDLKPIVLGTLKTRQRAHVTVDSQYLMELVEFRQHNGTISMDLQKNAPEKIKRLESTVTKLTADKMNLELRTKELFRQNVLLCAKADKVLNARLKLKLKIIDVYPYLASVERYNHEHFFIEVDKSGNITKKYLD